MQADRNRSNVFVPRLSASRLLTNVPLDQALVLESRAQVGQAWSRGRASETANDASGDTNEKEER